MDPVAIAADGRGDVHLCYVTSDGHHRGHLTCSTLDSAGQWTETDVVQLDLKPRLNQRGLTMRGCDSIAIMVSVEMTVASDGRAHLAWATQTKLGHALRSGSWSSRVVHRVDSDAACDALVDTVRLATANEPTELRRRKPLQLYNFGVLLPASCYPRTLLWGIEGLVVDDDGRVHLLYRTREFTLEHRDPRRPMEEDRWQYIYRVVPSAD